MIKNTDEIEKIKVTRSSHGVELGDDTARLVLVPPKMFQHYNIKESDFSTEPKDGYLIAFALFDSKNNPVGIALGKVSESNADNRNGTITIGSIKYNESTADNFSYITEKLKKHLVVDCEYDESRKNISFSSEAINEIGNFIIDMSNERKARKLSMEIDTPKLSVADVKEAGQPAASPAGTAKKVQI